MAIINKDGKYKWEFDTIGGATRVKITSGKDIAHLAELDPKMWTVLSCPVKGLEIDEKKISFSQQARDELAVLKNHIYPLLNAVQPEQSCYEQVRAMVKILNYVQPAQVDDEIPTTSLVREFIGGNSLYR